MPATHTSVAVVPGLSWLQQERGFTQDQLPGVSKEHLQACTEGPGLWHPLDRLLTVWSIQRSSVRRESCARTSRVKFLGE